MKKVLIIIYYWPPSGGPGVQRWVKLTKYLSELGVDVHILTVDEKYASYQQIDNSLLSDISEKINVSKTKSFEPIKYYGKMFGKKNIPTAGFSNVNNNSLKQKMLNAIRSNFFIPDPRRGWNKYAYKIAKKIILEKGIQTVITSSPPHSSQLIGLKLKNKLNVNWISDFRDPWTDIYYYKILNHSFISKRIDKYYEKKVIEKSDKIITVGEQLKELFLSKSNNINSNKIVIVPNGFDPADFLDKGETVKSKEFTISYTGKMSDIFEPFIFIDALNELFEEGKLTDFKLKFIGNISSKISQYIKETSFYKNVNFMPTVPHEEIAGYQLNSDILLLVIPNVDKSESILTGKIFEYLATGKNILNLGPVEGDAAKIIKECNAGETFDRIKTEPIKRYILKVYQNYKKNTMKKSNTKQVDKYSRKNQAALVKSII